MEHIPKFNCIACGQCCSKISGFLEESEKEFLSSYGYGKLPLVHFVTEKSLSFPLWDFEAKRFKEYEKNNGIDAKIVVQKGIFDLNSNTLIVVAYQMTGTACPFLLMGGKCKIYDTKRAFVCHLFPFNKSPFLDDNSKTDYFGICPKLPEIKSKLEKHDKKTLINQLHHSFGDAFLASVQHDYVIEWTNSLIVKMTKEKIIRPAINYPYELLKKRALNSPKIDFTQFLVQKGIYSKDQIKKKINAFENYMEAKERIATYTLKD